MLDRDSVFDSGFGGRSEIANSFEDAHDLKASFFQEEGSGLSSILELDFAAIEQYRESGEYNYEDRLSLFEDNQFLSNTDLQDRQEFFSNNSSDISGYRDSLLNSELNLEDISFGERDLASRDEIIGTDRSLLRSELLSDSELNLENIPFGERDLASRDEIAGTEKNESVADIK